MMTDMIIGILQSIVDGMRRESDPIQRGFTIHIENLMVENLHTADQAAEQVAEQVAKKITLPWKKQS